MDMLKDELNMTWDMIKQDTSYDQLMYFHQMAYIPLPLQQSTKNHKTFKVGFANIMGHIASCLRNNKLPTVANIIHEWQASSEWPPNTRTYLNKGGMFEYALDYVISTAVDQNYVHGDGDHWRTFKEDIKKLPKCEGNDDNFDIIRYKVYDPETGAQIVPDGPHYPPGYWDPKPLTEEQKANMEKMDKEQKETVERAGGEEAFRDKMRKIFGFDDDEEP